MGHREPKCQYPSETSESQEVKIAISSPENFQSIEFFRRREGGGNIASQAAFFNLLNKIAVQREGYSIPF